MTREERGLRREEFEEVMRRAAELSSSDPDEGTGAGLSEEEVLRIGREVGLPDRHLRRALSEVRSERPAPGAGGLAGRLWGPETLAASRTVPLGRDELVRALDRYFTGTTLLQKVRSGHSRLQYRPSVDWVSQVARTASSTARKYYVASARRIDVRLEPLGESRTRVELEVDPATRGEYLWGGFAGGIASGGVVAVVLTPLLSEVLLLTLPLALAVALVAGTLAGGAVLRWTAAAHRRKVDDVRQEMEGILDRLETGESLEPPPPAWRRWVRRHFHGISRELGFAEDESEV